ncbi:glycosyltransferase family 4 protein [Actinospongicola halichondriae]|uniref:glycosyltransferase family 4 protein n=1 Tax=Actinospongicola halichondriae TaxID=3236844 RepID=UPI003D53A557
MNICLLNQFYAPDVSPTAQLATSLIEHRAALGDECTVVCGSGGYADARDSRPLADAVRIRRAWSPSLGRSRIVSRATTYTAYFLAALWTMLRMPRQDVIVVMTTPPFVYLIALAHKLRHRDTRVVLWSMDVYPEVAERLRAVSERSFISRLLRRLNAWALPKLDSVIVLDGAMADLLRDAGAPADRVHVIPNWERASLYTGTDVARWPGYEQLGLTDRFVLLYLGNIGLGHQFETVVAAAPQLADDGVTILFVGGGPRWEDLRARAADVDNVVLHDYVDKDQTPGVLAGAHATLICLDDQALGVMSPSKLHGSLGMATPVVYVGPHGSNITEAIDRFACGVSVRTGDVDSLVAAVRAWKDDPDSLAQASAQARIAFLERYCDDATLPLWDELLDHQNEDGR